MATRAPLVVRWHGLDLPRMRAGATADATVELENAGAVTWRSRGRQGMQLAYHWLDELDNPIVWDGLRTALPQPVAPGDRLRMPLRVRGPLPPGRYRLAVDLVDEGRFWLAELGNEPLARAVEVAPRIERRLAVRGGDREALARQEEPLVEESDAAAVAHLAEGVAPAGDWSRRVLDAHQEGYAAVGGSVDARGGLLRRPPRELAPWAPGAGRVPGFAHPLLCPSLVRGVEPEWLPPVHGLPALRPPSEEPWVYDGRIRLRLRREL